MPGLMHNVIVAAEPDCRTLQVLLRWQNGAVTYVDFGPVAGQGAFTAFRNPTFFEQVQVIAAGHVLAWPGDLEFDADALWFEAHPEDSPILEAASLPH